jgi:hypothetical protein
MLRKVSIWIMISFVLLCCTQILSGLRPDYPRMTQQVEYSGYPDSTAYIITTYNYFYSVSNPALIDSINTLQHIVQPDTTVDYRSHLRLNHSIEQIDNLTLISYDEIDSTESVLNQYRFTLNHDDDVVEVYERRWTYPAYMDTTQIFIHYRSVGRADSIHWVRNSTHYYYTMEYDTANRLSASYKYLLMSGIWYPQCRYIQHYAENPEQFPAPLEYNKTRLYGLRGYTEFLNWISDRYVVADSITTEEWNNTWIYQPLASCYFTYDDVSQSYTLHDNPAYSGDYNYTYNSQGLITNHHYSDNGAPHYTGYNAYWETITANEDDTITSSVVLSMSAYPNPFASSVNISLQSKSNAPVKAAVYNIKGQLIKALGNSKALTWDGTDTNNQSVSNGIYFIQAEQNGRSVTSKVIRIK